jgi:hypothetical protein
MSRDDRLGSVYSSDLYLRSWEMERESSHRNLGLSESHLDHQEDQQMHQKYQDDLRSTRDSTPCVSTDNKLITGAKYLKHYKLPRMRKLFRPILILRLIFKRFKYFMLP